MSYRITRSLNGDEIIWIARENGKKPVLARAKSEEALYEILNARTNDTIVPTVSEEVVSEEEIYEEKASEETGHNLAFLGKKKKK